MMPRRHPAPARQRVPAVRGPARGQPRPFGITGNGNRGEASWRANDLADKFERGVPGVDLPTVMLEANKANLSFRAVTEVRNRLISAYTDIMNMQM